MGNFNAAIGHVLVCPHCGETDVPKAKPTLEKEQDGSYTCRTCSWNFRAPPA